MSKTWGLTLTTILLCGLVMLLSQAPALNAGVTTQYFADYTRLNEGGGIASTALYTIEDEIRFVGPTAKTQSSGSYTVTAPSFEEISAATPSNTKNWQDYR